MLPAYQPAIDWFVAAGGDADIPRALLRVKAEYLDATFDEGPLRRISRTVSVSARQDSRGSATDS
jgi:hypothetical protein